MPYFIDKNEDGELFAITEHNAIQYYVADRYWPDLIGVTPQERASVDMMMNIVLDLRMKTTMPLFKPDLDMEAMKKDAFEKARYISDFLRDKNYILGDNLSFADFSLYEVLNYADFICGKPLFEQYWDLLDYVKRIEALPQLSTFFAENGIEMKLPFSIKFAAKVNWPEVNYGPTRNLDDEANPYS